MGRTAVDAQHLTERAYKRNTKPPVGGDDLAGQHKLSGASVGINPVHAAKLEDRVRRRANRHHCQAPARLRKALAAAGEEGPKAASAAVLVEKIRANPGRYCGDPRHGEDAAWLVEVLEWLGLRDTRRRWARSDTVSARPKDDHGRCRVCGRRHALKRDGTLTAHKARRDGDRCPGSGQKPEEVHD